MTPRTREFALRLQIRQDARSALNLVADFHLQGGRSINQDIHTRTELDKSHALPALQPVANFRMEDDSSRQQARDLLEHHCLAVALYADNILLVQLGGRLIHGVQKLTALIANLAHDSRNRRTVYMHVENAQEDTDAGPSLAALVYD